jgi:hypothetical protein
MSMRLRDADPADQSDQRSSEQRLGNTTICLYVSAVSDGGHPVFWRVGRVPRGISKSRGREKKRQRRLAGDRRMRSSPFPGGSPAERVVLHRRNTSPFTARVQSHWYGHLRPSREGFDAHRCGHSVQSRTQRGSVGNVATRERGRLGVEVLFHRPPAMSSVGASAVSVNSSLENLVRFPANAVRAARVCL